jgi:hypothetical protein
MLDIKNRTVDAWAANVHAPRLFEIVSVLEDKEIAIDELQQHAIDTTGEDYGRQVVIQFFKFLQELGWGTFIVGRRSKKTRFQWYSGLRNEWPTVEEVAQATRLGETPERAVPEPVAGSDSQGSRGSRLAGAGPGISVVYHVNVRPGLSLDIEDLTAEEASALADAFRNLEKKLK